MKTLLFALLILPQMTYAYDVKGTKETLKYNPVKPDVKVKVGEAKIKDALTVEVGEAKYLEVETVHIGDTKMIEPGSQYCIATIAAETQSYKDHKKTVDKIMAPILKDLRTYLKSITPKERESVVQGIGGNQVQLEKLELKSKKFAESYNKTKSKKFEFMKDWDATDYNDPLGVPPLKAQITQMNGDVKLQLSVKISSPAEEENELKTQMEKYYALPPLQEYLAKRVHKNCFEIPKDGGINSDNRSTEKVLPVKKDNSKEKQKSSSGGVKN